MTSPLGGPEAARKGSGSCITEVGLAILADIKYL